MSRAAAAEADLSTWAVLRLFGRSLRYVAPLRRAFAVKLGLTLFTVVTAVFLPWPTKILLDHVVMGVPVEAATTPYPFFVAPFLAPLHGASPSTVLAWTLALQGVLLLSIGAIGVASFENGQTNAALASGEDAASTTENQANHGHSFAGGLIGLFEFRWTMRLTQALNHHYRTHLFERMQALPLTAFDDERIGDAVYRVMYDTPAITISTYRLLLTPIAAPFGFFLTVATVGLVFPAFRTAVWGCAAFVFVSLLATLPLTNLIRRRAHASRVAGAATVNRVEEGLANVLAVQSLGGQARQRVELDRDSEASFGSYRALLRVAIAALAAVGVPALLLVGWGILFIADRVVDGVLSVGDFGLLTTYFIQASLYALDLGALWVNIQGNAAGLQRVFELMDQPGEPHGEQLPPLAPIRHELEFERVGFSYGDGPPALQDISFRAELGQLVAFVGPTGAGKTTLAQMIPRFLAPRQGCVRIDGVDVSQVRLDSLRDQIAFVFQETILFDASIADNIRVGKPEASDEEVRQAARAAHADSWIERLPQGYDTRLGRSGGTLSVGQRQRLAIARALVRQAPILILDEPTSALDVETEHYLVQTLHELARDRLVVLIAHRLASVRHADQILFLEHGRLLEAGTHAALMARADGAYRRFVELQVGDRV